METLRSSLDEKGLAIAESQEMSMKSRKQLSEKTKGKYPQLCRRLSTATHPVTQLVSLTHILTPCAEFKRSVAPEVFKQFASLLKAYQEEVDSLTTRAKLGEAAFLGIFKQLYEAPDPAPAIAQGLVRIYLY